jgi:hypothetical protein
MCRMCVFVYVGVHPKTASLLKMLMYVVMRMCICTLECMHLQTVYVCVFFTHMCVVVTQVCVHVQAHMSDFLPAKNDGAILQGRHAIKLHMCMRCDHPCMRKNIFLIS